MIAVDFKTVTFFIGKDYNRYYVLSGADNIGTLFMY